MIDRNLDRLFLAAKTVSPLLKPKTPTTSAQGLVRWQWMEVLIRVADAVREKGASLGDALRGILEDHIAPQGEILAAELQAFRKALVCERIDGSFKPSLMKLRSIFDFYAGKHQHRP